MTKNLKPKHVPKTKEQLIAEKKQADEIIRQRALVTEKLYPLLLKCTKNIADASQFLAVLHLSIDQKFMQQKRTQTIADIKILDGIDPKADRADYYREFLDFIATENIATASGLIKGIGDEIDRLMKKEMNERSLTTLKTDFIKEGDKK